MQSNKLHGVFLVWNILIEVIFAVLRLERFWKSITGVLVVDKSITPELLEATVQKIKVYGKVQAQADVLAVIRKKEKRS